MKYLLLLLLLAYLFNRFGKRRAHKVGMPPAPPVSSKSAPQTIVACAQCGLHLPQDEALPGRGGLFCSVAHRNAFEAAHG